MAFTPQTDGPVVLGANSFATVAFFRSLLADRNISTTAYNDVAVQGALIEATDHQDGIYPWIGYPTTDDESRVGWPRRSAVVLEGSVKLRPGLLIPDTIVPLAVREATVWFALARLESGKPLAEIRRAVSAVLKSKKIGPIEKVWENPSATDRFPRAERCLSGFWYEDAASTIRLVR